LHPLSTLSTLIHLEHEQRLLSLPDDALRALSPAYVDGLPKEVREAIRQRIGERGSQEASGQK